MGRRLTYAEAIHEALTQAMEHDTRVICYGLGTDDPMHIFGTTAGLKERFGAERVFDMPAAENAMTGVAIGAALHGLKPVLSHQRLDFSLLALDQLVNNAAKWHYMFGGQGAAGITVRLIVGQGWGQGPTHSQALHAWLAHVPGLKVVVPTRPYDAKGLLLSAIFDPNPVVVIEHRWLHATVGEVPQAPYRIPIGRAKRLSEGDDLTLIATSYLTVEAQHAVRHMAAQGVHCDLLDLRSLSPIDWEALSASVARTGRLLVLDGAHHTGSLAGEVVATLTQRCFAALKQAPERLTLPDFPSPTSPALTLPYYPRAETIVGRVGTMLGRDLDAEALARHRTAPHDVPGDWFKGPF